MAQTVPPSITAAPTAPTRQQPSTFAARSDAFLAWMASFATQLVALGANLYSNAVDAYNSAVAAASDAGASSASAAASAASAIASASSAGAAMWASGTYAAGAPARSPSNLRVYINKTTGSRTIDPASDPTNWVDAVGGERIRVTSATALQVRCLYELDSSGGAFSVTLPASWADQDWIDLVDVGLTLATNNVTVLRAGADIRRVAEDLVLDVSGDSLRLVGRTTLGWIEQ